MMVAVFFNNKLMSQGTCIERGLAMCADCHVETCLQDFVPFHRQIEW